VPVPKGRLKGRAGSAVPSGLILLSRSVPSVETLGYSQPSLRDEIGPRSLDLRGDLALSEDLVKAVECTALHTLRDFDPASGSGETSGVRRQSEASRRGGISATGDVRERQPLSEPKRCRAPLATALHSGLPEAARQTLSLAPVCSICALTSALGLAKAFASGPNSLHTPVLFSGL